MAIKELIMTFAIFMGYEMPDSSGDTGTIIDQMNDSMGDFGTSVDDANSGLDNTAKKAKEAKKQLDLMAFDEINKMSDKSDSSSGGSSGAGGAGYIDPRILDALNNWDYAFGNIRMKAMDIRDILLKWMDVLGKMINENIFKPIRNSWNKYGSGIEDNVRKTFKNISHIVSGVFDVVGDKWKPFFQSATDLFFSLLETGSLVTSGLSKFFKSVWDNGGSYLLEAVFDLGTALMELATKVNDDFIKPVVEMFNDYFAKELGRIFGAVLETVGDFINVCSDFISWLAEDGNTTLKTFVSLWGAIKLKNLITDFRNLRTGVLGMSDGMSKTDATMTILTGSFGKLGKGISNVIAFFKTLFKDGFSRAITLFPSMNRVWDIATTYVGKFGTSIGGAVTSVGNLASKALPGLSGILGKVGGWLSSASFAPWVIGITGAITGITLLINWLESFSNKVDPVKERIEETAESISKLKDKTYESIDANREQIDIIQAYADELKDSIDEEGNVIGSKERVTELIIGINEVLPDSVYWTEQGTVAYKENAEQLQKNIKLKEAEMQLSALEPAYKEAIMKRTSALTDLGIKNNEMKEQQLAIDQAVINYDKATTAEQKEQLRRRVENERKKMDELKETRDQALKNYQDYVGITNQYSDLQVAIQTGNMDDLETALGNLSVAYDENGDAYINSLALEVQQAQLHYDTLVDMSQIAGNTISEEEISNAKYTLERKKQELKKEEQEFSKAKSNIISILKSHNANWEKEDEETYSTLLGYLRGYGFDVSSEQTSQYETMIASLKEHGIQLTSENIQIYTGLLGLLKKHGVDMSNEENIRHAASLIQMGQDGSEEGMRFLALLKYGVSSGNIDPELASIISDGKSFLDKDGNKVTVGVNVEDPEWKVRNMLASIQSILNKNDVKVMVSGSGAVFKKAVGFATGGFPEVGEMFIARESGPELVGSMGGRTAVANNYQIENGIYRAVKSALGGAHSKRGGNLHLTINMPDGTKIEKVIEDYNKLMSRNGGKGGFII